MAKPKRRKTKEPPKDEMMPNLSGVSFKDALKALLKTPRPNAEEKMMTDTPKIGRPTLPKSEKRWKFVSTRLSPGEYQEIEKAVASSGDSKTEWIRKKLVAAARRA